MATPSDDVSDQTFWYTAWITAEGQLTPDNVMEYFETSLFWDPSSTNAALKMQNQYSNLAQENSAEQLRKFTGVEFALVHAEPPDLFIIHKRQRLSPTEAYPLAAYFIMNNRIYYSPDIYSVISGRLRSSLYTLHTSLKTLSRCKPDFSPRRGHLWPVELEPVKDPINGVQSTGHTINNDTVGDPTTDFSQKTELREPKVRTEIRPLLHSMESARRQLQQQLAASRMNIDPPRTDAESSVPLAFELPRDVKDTSPQTLNTMTIGSSNPSTAVATFTPLTGTRGSGSSRATTLPELTPDSPFWVAQNLGSLGHGVPGGGKKKRKRQATVAQRAAGTSESAQGSGQGTIEGQSPT